MNDENLTSPGEDADSDGEGSVSNGGRCCDECASSASLFRWTYFYEAMANGLLAFRYRRSELLAEVCALDDNLKEKNLEGKLEDICPFSVMARFNRNGPDEKRPKRDEKRTKFAKSLARSLEMSEISKYAPENFGNVGIPILPSMNALFFPPPKEEPQDGPIIDTTGSIIDTMWELFAYALDLASGMEDKRDAFIRSYNKALDVKWVGVAKLTMGLYWIRPRFFLSLDVNSRDYIKEKLGISIPYNGPKKIPKGETYLDRRDKIEARFQENTCSVRSFPELTFKSAKYADRKEAERKKAEEAEASSS